MGDFMKLGTTSLVVLAVAGFVAGCGSSSNNPKSGAAGKGATATSSKAATAPSAAPSFASTGNCQRFADLGAQYLKAVHPSGSGGQIDLGAAVQADQALADASPPAIHADAETVVHVFTGYVSTVQRLGYKPGATPTPAMIAGITGYVSQIRQPRIQAAMQRIKAWINQNCRGVR